MRQASDALWNFIPLANDLLPLSWSNRQNSRADADSLFPYLDSAWRTVDAVDMDDRMLVNFNSLLPSMLLEPGVQRACELGLQEVLLASMLVPRSTPASPQTSLRKSEGQGWTPVRFACYWSS